MLELLAKRAVGTEPGFAEQQIRWGIAFDRRGKFLDIVELGDAGQRGNRGQSFACCPEFDRRYMQRGGKSEFLWGPASVVALHADEPEDEGLSARHEHFVALLKSAAKSMPELGPVAQALEDDGVLAKVRKLLTDRRARPTDRATLRVGDEFPIESKDWHEWWRTTYTASSAPSRGGSVRQQPKGQRKMVCLATGEIVEPMDTHPKIKGLVGVGGQGMGDVLVGMDKDAFTSYFLEQSANAAVSREAAYRYRAALNDLIRRNSRKLAGALVVHWFKEKVRIAEDPLAWLEEPPAAEEGCASKVARDLLDSIAAGRRADLGINRYYALTLSGMSGRVMVRDWMEGQFKDLAGNIARWFDDLSVTSREGGGLARDPKFMAVLGATVRELDVLPPPFVAKMWRVAVRCEPIPRAALVMALSRFKADILDREKIEKHMEFNHARMGLMKAYHIRKTRVEGKAFDMRIDYNWAHASAAYHSGGQMAVLAKLQQAALGDIGAGIVQRYYAAASTTPKLVLGRLLRGGQYHLNKLDPGLAHWYEDRLSRLALAVGDDYPQTLTVEGQSLFALGYYQMWADLRTRKSDDCQKEA
jgi:CRISPR-associated protein Csd1